MDVNKNSYIFGFSALLVIVVAAVLSFAAESLKPMQTENVRIEKMQNILTSVGISATPAEAGELFDQYIIDQKLLSNKGAVVDKDGLTAFDIDAVKQYKDKNLSPEEKFYPLFTFQNEEGKKYIVPMAGKGLWGPIWGYVAFAEDMNTIVGSTFDHKSETPGLGAEIKEDFFTQKFIGKTIFEGNEFVSVEIVKGGQPWDSPHKVDGISGGTITSVGVGEMMERTLGVYVPYFKNTSKASL
ncbi:NADH:ubiquinone reductase (Na(+)-transporting) subunit C [Vicingaceae bacterium]|nr:NADH:ubiquinone reductase (Na(+)-transporting) subunit C [Vicingaceae bacterium]